MHPAGLRAGRVRYGGWCWALHGGASWLRSVIELLAIPALAFIGHVRGQWNEILPGPHPRFWCLPVVFAIACVLLPLATAALFASCWLIMHWLAWGRWYDLGHWDAEARKPPSLFERLIERVPGNDAVHLTIRNVLCGLPLCLINPWLLCIAPLSTLAYVAGWRIDTKTGNQPAEWIAGALWGAALCAISI